MDKAAISKIEYRDGGLWLDLGSRAIARRMSLEYGEKVNSGKRYDVEIKQHRERRSLDANAYFWVLVGKLAEVLRISSTEIYRELIRGIGNNFEIVPIKISAVDDFCKAWEQNGKGWCTERTGSSKWRGYENIIIYYGSSTYDTAQMSRLIDLAIQECQEQGIETMPPDKVALLKENWNEQKNKSTSNTS